MKVAVAVLPNGMVNAHFGRANKLAFATIENKQIISWEEVAAPFAETHGHDHHHEHEHGYHHHDHDHHHEHGHHHQAIKNFLVEHQVDLVLLDHAGPGMQKVINETDIKIVIGAKGNAKDAVQALADQGFVE